MFLVDNLNRISDGGYSSNGDPMATYAVGPRSFNSVSPWQKYTMRGGTMRARCQVKTVRTGMGFRVILGPIIWYDYTGEIDLASNDGTFGGQSRGWSFSNHASVTGAGSGNDGTTPQSVMDKFLAGGNDRCTVGWEIWVDGMRKCDAEGNYFS